MGGTYLTLDIGGTYVKYAIADGEGRLLTRGRVPSRTGSEEETLASLADVRADVGDDYEGVAISMPGRIDTATGIAHTGGAYAWVSEYPAAERYGALFGKPTTIANDGKCAALAESWRGSLSDVDSGAVLVLGTFIGGGIVLNHEVLTGTIGGAGELSFVLADFAAARYGVGASNIDALWAGHVSANALTSRFAAAKGIDHAGGTMFFDALDAGDADARRIMDEFGFMCAAGILSVQAVLDLGRYAIGGGISARGEVIETIARAVDELFDQRPDPLPFGQPEIVRCTFGSEANLIGALAFHLKARGRLGRE